MEPKTRRSTGSLFEQDLDGLFQLPEEEQETGEEDREGEEEHE